MISKTKVYKWRKRWKGNTESKLRTKFLTDGLLGNPTRCPQVLRRLTSLSRTVDWKNKRCKHVNIVNVSICLFDESQIHSILPHLVNIVLMLMYSFQSQLFFWLTASASLPSSMSIGLNIRHMKSEMHQYLIHQLRLVWIRPRTLGTVFLQALSQAKCKI